MYKYPLLSQGLAEYPTYVKEFVRCGETIVFEAT